MPLEATMIVIDNSEYMRNGDYQPTRFEAQSDAVNAVFQTKTDSNPENSVGIMTMAGKAPEVLVTHTRDLGQILQGVHSASRQISGAIDLTTAINVALLALKHRQNKNLRQRLVVFVGSPLDGQGTDEKSMGKLAKKLKKNNVAVDVVCFGDGMAENGENAVLKAFVDGANSGDNSHMVVAPPDPRRLLSDVVISSPILASERGLGLPDEVMGDVPPGGDGAAGGEFGIDPSVDPELAMALRMSLEEEAARQAAAKASTNPPAASSAGESSSTAGPSTAAEQMPGLIPATSALATAAPAASSTTAAAEPTDDEEAALLKQALEMSATQAPVEDVEMHDHSEDMSEEEAIARAIAMSMQGEDPEAAAKK
ncbi:hypothetical protein BD410DRAFT_732124 [Rickenella mellea]|uniref:VWFA domain-containing protein n=1 Tax=Rickenella mellea TaxID=50990 RepID=A0A4Y7PL61_9AGAM|nr:hypothetical protein BD410DRAFT_732124 [Rickenella mellea]